MKVSVIINWGLGIEKRKINILYYFNLLFYILIWKEIIKKIIFFMGTHKIERILEPEDISYLKYLELSN